MVSIGELKQIYLLQRLTDQMIERISPHIEVAHYGEKEVIVEQGQKASRLFMLRKGKAILKVDASEAITISLGSIKPGYSFGWSSILPGQLAYTSSVVAAEPCEVYSVSGEKFYEFLSEDRDMGFRIMEGVARILENRLERRTSQFLKALSRHIDIEGILS